MKESPNQREQIEAAVRSILCLGEVALQVLVDIDVVIGAPDRGFEVGDDGIDPAVLTQRNASISLDLRGLTTISP
jgi:hypothetical protein